MDLESMPRRSGRARATALAALALAAVAVLAGCDGGTEAASDAAASGGERASASASASPGAATGSADPAAPTSTSAPTAPAPVTTPPVDPTATAPDPRPTGPAPATKPPAPATTPTPAPTPPGSGGNGIAVGEPPPNGTGSGSPVHPAITYRVDGNKLTVWFYGGICQRYALKADESKPGRVDVRVTTAAPVPAGQACAELAKRQTVTADLKQPLQGRAVTDLATGQEVPLEADAKIGPDPAVPDVPGNP
ncbi:hypothetical protein [Kitasatospora sp. MBT66]|uniref:hypothetical protein n=1 Tax=Kitasatospora sp. MBT66 TaxID=1444769 RepID=UPI000690D6B4|nr:hypothetical protein [Kitasatospora sp. MBT66]